MNALETVFHYHDRTKHHPDRYAASLGYMDWATQPDPFRRYHGAPLVKLPLMSDVSTPAYRDLFSSAITAQPLSLEHLSQMLQFSMGLAAWKSIGTDRWALRCNASSGNLHPSETYLIAPPLPGIDDRSSVSHYAPKEHGVELLGSFETTLWDDLPQGSFLLILTSVIWREMWKYGERCFRYCQLDAGHAQRAIEVSAAMLGWHCQPLHATPQELQRLCGIDQSSRFIPEEQESADMVLLITPEKVSSYNLTSLLDDLPMGFEGSANRLSPSHHPWEVVDAVDQATQTPSDADSYTFTSPPIPSEMTALEVVLKRRSARAMDFGFTHISRATFNALMQSVAPAQPSPVHFILFIHDVEGLEPGLYMLVRNTEQLETLRASTREDFLWDACDDGLYLLEAGDFKPQAKFISCSQEIASDGAFSMGMLCEYRPQLEQYGSHRYKELYWECGAIGQQLYLEATALGLSATGIGCFLDDVLHRLLGLRDDRFQSLYHFTIGHAIVDMRLTTLPPYYHLGDLR